MHSNVHEHHHHHEHPPAAATVTPPPPAAGTVYTCPMHPQVRQDHPGNCPICGMTLEPVMPSLDEKNPELDDFRRRFWGSLPFTIVVFLLAMLGHRQRQRQLDPALRA
jgi:P-type Cu+ transporter